MKYFAFDAIGKYIMVSMTKKDGNLNWTTNFFGLVNIANWIELSKLWKTEMELKKFWFKKGWNFFYLNKVVLWISWSCKKIFSKTICLALCHDALQSKTKWNQPFCGFGLMIQNKATMLNGYWITRSVYNIMPLLIWLKNQAINLVSLRSLLMMFYDWNRSYVCEDDGDVCWTRNTFGL